MKEDHFKSNITTDTEHQHNNTGTRDLIYSN